MKARILKNIYAALMASSLFLTCAEAETITAQLIWSGSMMAVCWFSAKRMDHYMTEEEKQEKA